MYCPKCGKYLADTARFCVACGYQISEKESMQQKQQPFLENASTTASGGGAAMAFEVQNESKASKTIGIVVAAVVIVSAIVLVLVLVFTNQKSPVANVQVGDVIHLGEVSFSAWYGGEFKEDIAWRVLAIEDGRVLLIAEDIIELRPYNERRVDTTWEQSTIRQWLNTDFYNGLPQKVKQYAATTLLINADNPTYGTPGGNNTTDKVFLLSIDEANKYFRSSAGWQADINLTLATILWANGEYADDGVVFGQYVSELGCWVWWLRSPGHDADRAAFVFDVGEIYGLGTDLVFDGVGVRPAMWLSM